MRFVNLIKSARNFHEVEFAIREAKSCNSFHENVIIAAIKKLTRKESKNVQAGYEMVKLIHPNNFPSLDKEAMESILNLSSQANDYKLAHMAFNSLKYPNAYDFYYYVNAFREAKIQELPPKVIEELSSLWIKAEQYRVDNDYKLLVQLFQLLSFSKERQRALICQIISKEPRQKFTCSVLGTFLNFCIEENDLELAKSLWTWGEGIRERENGSYGYFLCTTQYYGLFTPPAEKLYDLWCQIVDCRLQNSIELITSMCTILAPYRNQQRQFIIHIISREPHPTFHYGVLGAFLRHCEETNNVALAKEVWEWGEPIRQHENQQQCIASRVHFQYLRLCGTEKEMEAFILMRTSLVVPPKYNCVILGSFISFCSDTGKFALAKRVWQWGLEIRLNWKGTIELCNITCQYISICSSMGDLDLVENVWEEAKYYRVAEFKEAQGAVICAFAAKGAADRIMKLLEAAEIPIEQIEEKTLISTAHSLCLPEHDVTKASNLLKYFLKENPKIVNLKACTPVIEAFCEKGNFEDAFALIEEAKSHGIEPNASTFLAVLNSCASKGNLPFARKAFEAIKGLDPEPDDLAAANSQLSRTCKACGDETAASEEAFSNGLLKVRPSVKLMWSNNAPMSFYLNEEIPELTSTKLINQTLPALSVELVQAFQYFSPFRFSYFTKVKRNERKKSDDSPNVQ